ncbi:hypothetical protein [Actinocorallia aurantiaca]|uniref:Uncharacterized protein n=1 Tax=Actinocorallia aurantiaca TaxID=46204 RepID=A0ABN3UPX0_9ACTN
MKPTRSNANPPDPSTPSAGSPCGCSGSCGLHPGPCPAKQFHRYPGTRTTVHLEATEDGQRCPFCLLAATRPNAASQMTAAALRCPSADGDQDDLFDTTPYQRTSGRR